jgi:hypothetical protein
MALHDVVRNVNMAIAKDARFMRREGKPISFRPYPKNFA